MTGNARITQTIGSAIAVGGRVGTDEDLGGSERRRQEEKEEDQQGASARHGILPFIGSIRGEMNGVIIGTESFDCKREKIERRTNG
jgi:hypothetical protein